MSRLLNCEIISHSNDNTKQLLINSFDGLDSEDLKFLENEFVKICKGDNSSYDIRTIAKKVRDQLQAQTDNTKIGATAEFFVHLLLRKFNYKQQCCYRNLEENSIKKGFDGVYSKEENIYLMESKSSSTVSQHNNKHLHCLDLAYDGLTGLLSGNTPNDPWENAASHASVSTGNLSLQHKFEQLSKKHTNGEFSEIEDQNIIPASTLYVDDLGNVEIDASKIKAYMSNHRCASELAICLATKNPDILINILDKICEEA
jgi:hypothetical protein